jgi:RNA-directed DNA polymerase
MDKLMLRKWLKAGYFEEGKLYPTEAGTPQGGIASPILANFALDGLEAAVKAVSPRGTKVNVIRYADDCVPRTHRRMRFSGKCGVA